MSVTQRWSGRLAVKSRASRAGWARRRAADWRPWSRESAGSVELGGPCFASLAPPAVCWCGPPADAARGALAGSHSARHFPRAPCEFARAGPLLAPHADWRWTFGESVVTLPAHAQQPAESHEREIRLLRVDERESHSLSFTKKAAATSSSQGNRLCSFSSGERNPKVFRGRWLRRRATSFKSRWVYPERSVSLGKYCRSSRLVFSFVPRCHGLFGSQK